MIEHWVNLRCAGIRQAQYTYTWACHIYRESRLAPHTDITPPHPSRPWSKPLPTPTYNTHTTATKTQTYVQHCSHRIGKVQTQFSHPLTPSTPLPPRAKHIHISHTPPTPHIPLGIGCERTLHSLILVH